MYDSAIVVAIFVAFLNGKFFTLYVHEAIINSCK